MAMSITDSVCFNEFLVAEGQTNRQTDKQTETDTQRQTDRLADNGRTNKTEKEAEWQERQDRLYTVIKKIIY